MSEKIVRLDTSSLFTTLLLVLFIGLKLGGVITWSWWWVLAPFWIPLVLAVVVLLAILAIGAIVTR